MIDDVLSRAGRQWGTLLLTVLCAVMAGLAAPSGFAQLPPGLSLPSDEGTSKLLSVTAKILPAAAQEPLRLSITGDVADGWHTYSITQADGGTKPTRIELTPSDEYKLAGPYAAQPAPTVKKYPEYDVPIEEHEHEVTWTAPLRLAAGVDPAKLVIRGSVKAVICSDRCVPTAVSFEARLASSAASPAPATATATPVPATPAPAAPPPADFTTGYLTLRGELDRAAAAPGQTVLLVLTATPAKGWHMYALKWHELIRPELKRPGEAEPTVIAVADRAGLKVGAPVADRRATEKKDSQDPLLVNRYYAGPVRFTLPIEVPSGTKAGDLPISGYLGFQTCSNDSRLCDTPKGVQFAATLPVRPEGVAGESGVRFAASSYTVAAQAAKEQRAWDAVAGVPPVAAADAEDGSESSQTEFRLDVLAVNLLAAFFGGLILNLMPCVLPVLGLKVMSFVTQAGESRRRVLALNLWFTLGVVSVFLAMAALAAFTQVGWSGQFQQVSFRIFLAAVVFVFALSLLGVWEIPLPGFVGSQAAHQAAQREGFSGAAAKGVLSTLLATPCVGPFLAVPLTWTSNLHSAPLTFVIFGTIGLGMASPYLAIGMWPNLIRFLPKPGAWMETFKNLMGFALLATVVWIFWTIPPRLFVPTLALLFGLWMGCWWIGRTPLTAELGDKLTAWGVAAVISAVIGIGSFQWLGEEKPRDVWQPFTPQALRELRARHIPVLIDFTATWCATCQSNKFWALHTTKTEQYMRENGIVGLVADKTDDAPDVDKLMVQLGQTSKVIPFYAVYPADGRQPITYDQGPLFQGKLLEMLQQAGHAPAAASKAATVSRAPPPAPADRTVLSTGPR